MSDELKGCSAFELSFGCDGIQNSEQIMIL